MTEFESMSCSAAAAVDIPLPGSATHVTGWLCVEHPGAWGRDVLGDEVLGADITGELAARVKAARVRPTLIRRPGRHEFTGDRTVLLVGTRPRGAWCERLTITEPKQLLDLDLDLLNGPAPGIGEPVGAPPILVCTHGKRDQCCALHGRPIAARLAEEFPGRVWECSHTGGHRFAPALVLLPTGLTYGRVDIAAAVAAVAASDQNALSLNGFRGRSCYRPVEQMAEIAVRERVSAAGGDLIVAGVRDAEPTGEVATFAGAATVAHRDGRRWLVTARTVGYAPRPASCGAPTKPATAVVLDEIHELD